MTSHSQSAPPASADSDPDSTPCTACTWTTHRQRGCSCKSHVQIFYECSDRAVWSLGSRLILKDRGPSHHTNEKPSVRFVKEHTSIYVPDILEPWEENDGHAMTLMRRVLGVPLSKAWPNLSNDERENIARQTAESLLELRKLQSESFYSLNAEGGQIRDSFLFDADKAWVLRNPITSDEALWKEMEPGIPDSIPQSVRERLRQTIPPAQPYTFTHGDLTDVNIMVENGSLSGIIDWESAAYYPAWWEYAKTSILNSEEDYEWKVFLRKYMPDHSKAREWWRVYYWLCRDKEHEVERAFIEEMEGVV